MSGKTVDAISTKIDDMEQFIHELNQLPDSTRVGLLLGSLLATLALESLIPNIEFGYQKLRHVATNMVFILTSGIISLGLAFLAYGIIDITRLEFGLFYIIGIPLWMQLVISLLLLDFFGQYLVHVCLHRYKWMWKLHLVHHSDTTVDASTGTRHHPGDILVRELLIFGVIVCVGIPAAFYVLYRIITPFFAYFTHANIRLPIDLDRALSWIIVTPHMHKFHHHFERPWTNSNYGNILSCWDRMFGTFVYDNPDDIYYGLDTVDGQYDLNLAFQFSLPFNKTIKTDY
jgi:sterol desaturase/sphingolipid hydroxylase (fatty acid hydroxylase superfamily)